MSGGEMAYLGLVLAAFVLFMGVLGWASLERTGPAKSTRTTGVADRAEGAASPHRA
jgi:hypothetical protein